MYRSTPNQGDRRSASVLNGRGDSFTYTNTTLNRSASVAPYSGTNTYVRTYTRDINPHESNVTHSNNSNNGLYSHTNRNTTTNMNTDSYTGARASSDTRAQKANISNYSMHDRVGGSTRMDPSVRLLSKTLSLARAQTSGVYAPVCMRENSMSIAPRPHSVTHAHDRDGGLGDVADTSTYKFAPVQKAHTSGLPYSHTHTSSSLGVSGGYSRSQQTPNNRPTPGLSGNRESSREYRGSERGSASVRDTSSIHRDSTHARQYSLTYAQPDTRTRANRNTDTHTYPDTHTRTNTNTSRHRHADTHASTQGMPSSHTRLSNHYEGSTRLSGLVGHADPGEDMDEDRFEEESTQSKGSPGRSIGSMSTSAQEFAILEDLLFVMIGIPGEYVHRSSTEGHMWRIDRSLDKSLSDLTKRLLPLCEHFTVLDEYTRGIAYGQEVMAGEHELSKEPGKQPGRVQHSLRGAIDDILKPYVTLVAQLENQFRAGQLTLQRLWALVQDDMRKLGLLAKLVTKIRKYKLRGGGVLTLLHGEAMKCYKESPERALLVHLAERACVPYLDTLGRWLYEGVIVDPFREFLVQESPPIKNRHALSEEEYWERKYKLDEAMCPDFLFPYMEKIIKAGKYLNVATASGAAAKCPFAAQISYTTDTHAYARDIEKAYDFASEQLLRLLRDDLHIMTHMRSIKLFFLMERGDMYEQLMLTGRLELQQPRAEIQESVLDALLRNSIASSTAATDPNGHLLQVRLRGESFIAQLSKILQVSAVSPTKVNRNHDQDIFRLSGLEAMSFEYKAPWPLPLILTRTSLTKYTLLSRHLFHCKGLENKVSQTWMIGGQATMQKARTACPRAFALRQRILQFLQSLLYYTQCEVIEPLWKEMEAVLTNSKSTLDDFIASHADFLDTCIIQCMLTSEPVLKTIYKLLMICRDFTGMFSSLVSGSRDQTHLQWYTQTETRFGELGLDLIKGLRKISNLNQDGEKAASFLRSLECLT